MHNWVSGVPPQADSGFSEDKTKIEHNEKIRLILLFGSKARHRSPKA